MPTRIAKTPEDTAALSASHPDIIRAADKSYQEVANIYKMSIKKIHRQRVCAFITRALISNLEADGYDPFQLGRDVGVRGTHMYLGLESARGLILVDGTWQQFVPRLKRNPTLPRVLVGTRNEAVNFAEDAGVKTRHLDYWVAEASLKVRHDFDSRYTFGLIE